MLPRELDGVIPLAEFGPLTPACRQLVVPEGRQAPRNAVESSHGRRPALHLRQRRSKR